MSRLTKEIRERKPGKAKQADHKGSRKNAIDLFCEECCGGCRQTAKNCCSQHCFLWPFRPGGDNSKRDAGVVPTEQEYDDLLCVAGNTEKDLLDSILVDL